MDYEPDSDEVQAATEGFCDGSSEIKLVAMDALGPGALREFSDTYLYDGAFFLIDGKCHFYALGFAKRALTMGVVTSELLAQLTADLGLDSLPALPSSKDTASPHYQDTLLATQTHSVRCRDMQCRSPEALATIEQASNWISKLVEMGKPTAGALTAFARPRLVLPPEATEEDEIVGPVLEWPLKPTLRSLRQLLVTDILPTRGLEFTGEPAASLRKLRSDANEEGDNYEATGINVTDCGQTYRLLLRDELPSRHTGDFEKFLERAWARPVVESCIVDPSLPDEVTPCPAD
jgi:hypothetical protein